MGFAEDVKIMQEWLQTGGMPVDDHPYKFLLGLLKKSEAVAEKPECDRQFTREKIYGKILIAPEEGEARSTRLRNIANNAEKWLHAHQERYIDFARSKGAATYLSIAKAKGRGGSGKLAKHFLETLEIPDVEEDEEDGDRPAGTISYTEDDAANIKLNLRGRFLFGRPLAALTRARKQLFISSFMIEVILMCSPFIFLIALWFITPARPVTNQDLAVLLTSMIVALWLWFEIFKPIGTLGDRRMTLLPDRYLKGDQPPTQLEKVANPEDLQNSKLRVTRYYSSCGICGGELRLADGGQAWPDRFVGRCINDPQEHVYSFDRVSMLGRPLRKVTMTERPAE